MGNGASINKSLNNNNYLINIEKNAKQGYYYNNYDEYKELFEKAVIDSSLDVIEILIVSGDTKKLLPIHLAIKHSNLEVLEILISAGFSLANGDKDGNLPIHLAAKIKTTDSILCLAFICLHSPRLIDTKNKFGQTALHLSIACDNLSAFINLIHYGANVYSKDNNNQTCLQLANHLNRKSMIEAYREYTSPKKKEPDVDKIMLVWEKFFENASKGFMTEYSPRNIVNKSISTLEESNVIILDDIKEWFDWVLYVSIDYNYNVVNKVSFEMRSLSHHLNGLDFECLSSSDDQHLPSSLSETLRSGWMVYYDMSLNECYWCNAHSYNCEYYLPISRDKQIDITSLDMTRYDDTWVYINPLHYIVNQWILVIREDESIYYYHQMIGYSQYDEPNHWNDLIDINHGWIMCCYENDYDNTFWWNSYKNCYENE